MSTQLKSKVIRFVVKHTPDDQWYQSEVVNQMNDLTYFRNYLNSTRPMNKKVYPEILVRLKWVVLPVSVLIESWVYRFKIWQCSKFGHKWTDTSYGTPELGCMSVACSRCGEEHSTRLY